MPKRITGSPTVEWVAATIYTGLRKKRGDRSRRPSINRNNTVVTEKRFKVERYLTGYEEQYFENAFGGTEKKRVLTVIDAVSNPKGTKKPGKRKHKQAQSLHFRGRGTCHTVPVAATEVVSKGRVKGKGKPKHEGPHFDKDGCFLVRVNNPLVEHGYTTHNKHTVDPEAFDSPSGPALTKSRIKLGDKPKPTVVDNSPDQWIFHSIRMTGKSKLKTATIEVRNTLRKLKKTVQFNRVRNEIEALVMLQSVYGITA